jgi:anti-sigma regulatory factor (Ser/Thr protein kinase)
LVRRDGGYVSDAMNPQQSELRLPADRSYLVVAKRSVAALATVAGFDLDDVDDLTIAVSQAFENAVSCVEQTGALAGQVRIAVKLDERGLEVLVRSTVNREAELEAEATLRAKEERAVRREAARLQQTDEVVAATDLALRLMGLFVDDSSYRRDERTGGLRVRLTKYRVS